MNITLPALDIEQQAQLDAMLANHNQQTGQSLTAPEYLASILMGILNEAKRRKIDETGRQLINAARQLSDADRLDFTAQVAALLANYQQ